MKRKYLTYKIALFALFVISQNVFAAYLPGNKRQFPLYANGVPCAIDSTNKTIYCSIKPFTGSSFKVAFTSDVFDSVRINYGIRHMGDSITFTEKLSHYYTLFVENKMVPWKLYFTTLPIVFVDASDLNTSQKSAGYITIIDPMNRTGNTNNYIHYAGIRIRGAAASGLPKKAFAVELWDSSKNEEDASVMGMREDGDIILDAMCYDRARMRNRLSFDFWNKIDSIPYAENGESKINGTVGTYVEVLVNGEYNGLYCLTDKIDRKKLHLKKYQPDAEGEGFINRGLLWKARAWSTATRFLGYDENASTTNTLYWCDWEQKYPNDDGSFADWSPLISLLNFTVADINTDKELFSSQLGNRYYMQNLVDYFLLLNAFHIIDNGCKNVYLSYQNITKSPSRALFTPWDMDASWGRSSWDGTLLQEYAFTDLIPQCGLFKRLLDDDPANFHRIFHDTWLRWSKTCFSVDSVEANINAYRDLFISSGAWTREANKWTTYASDITTEAKYMVDWYTKNVAVIDDYVKDFPSDIQDITVDHNIMVAVAAKDGHVQVDALYDTPAKIRIYDTSGSMVGQYEGALPYESIILNQGIYIVNVEIGGTSVRKKIAVR